MVLIRSQIRKWGNSYGIIIPKNIMNSENLKNNQKIELILLKESKKVLKETFGTLKFKKSTEKILEDTDKELYNE